MRCLVIGGGGFVGSWLVTSLAERHDVRVLTRSSPLRAGKFVDWRTGDYNDVDVLRDALRGVDAVIHLAWSTLPASSQDDPVRDVTTNVGASIQLMDGCRKAGIRKIVFASSGGTVYGISKDDRISETHPTNPICSYGITKLAVEKYLHIFRELHGLEYVVLRIANPYGHSRSGVGLGGAVGTFLSRALRDEEIVIWGDGSVARDYLHISDVADAFLRVLESDPPSRIYNIGTGLAHTLNELIVEIERITGKQLKVKHTAARGFDAPRNCLDIRLASAELGWLPRVPLPAGIADTWEALLKR
jgi:UDP-glucose 4-epimerase